MGLGSFLKKYAEAKGAVSPATPHTSVSSQMVSANPVSPATLPAVNPVSPATLVPSESRNLATSQSCNLATLPDVISHVKHQTVLANTVLPATLHRKVQELPREERLLRDEKCLYIKMCYELHVKERKPWPAAASFVAVHFRDRFPMLAAKNLMNLSNLRNWRAQLCENPGANRPDPNAPPDFRYMDNLIRDYGHTRGLYGDPRFYIQLKAIIMSTNKAVLNKEYRKLADSWMREYPELKIPKLSQVRYHLKSLPPRLMALACKGETWYAQHYENYIARDPDSVRVNEDWVADNLECDFYIRVPDGNGGEKAVRPWVCAIMDVKSRYIVGCLLMENGIDNAVIRATLAAAILNHGRPMRFVMDNGKDFGKRGFTTPVVFTPSVDNSVVYEHSILKELAIEPRFTDPYNAKAKPVERFFKEINEFCREERGWVGNCIENRPSSAELWSRPENCKYLKDRDAAAKFLNEILNHYHALPQPDSKYLKGLSPDQAFRSPGNAARPVASIQELAFAFLMPIPESRIVEPRGPSVTVGRVRYVAEPGPGREKLWMYDRKPVMVKFDMQSIQYCYVFDLDGTPLAICRAEQQIPYFYTDKEEEAVLSKALAEKNHDKKVLNGLLLSHTGGHHKLDPETIAQLPPEAFEHPAKLRLVASRTAVKGDSHNPKIHVTKQEFKEKSQTVLTDNPVSRATLQEKNNNRKLDPELRRKLLATINGEEESGPRPVIPTITKEEEETNHVTRIVNPY